jgi:diphosphomevalonate decarboxylase
MINRVKTRAFANIALTKYWGKIEGPGNLPATPSISLALEALSTETEIECLTKGPDRVSLNGSPADESSYRRLVQYLDYWRDNRLIDGNFAISSTNYFPTKAGLASSSSGFAALAAALGAFSNRKIGKAELSRLARRGSGSAARSIPGGLAAINLGKDPASRLLIPAEKVPWGMVVAIVGEGSKKVGSRTGMEQSRLTSPYYRSWVAQAKRDYSATLKAIREMDFTRVGEIAEANALAMHACMIATRPGLVYWNATTVELIRSVQNWRYEGLETYFTIDAGHHVILFGKREDLKSIATRVKKVANVKAAIASSPGSGAEIILCE